MQRGKLSDIFLCQGGKISDFLPPKHREASLRAPGNVTSHIEKRHFVHREECVMTHDTHDTLTGIFDNVLYELNDFCIVSQLFFVPLSANYEMTDEIEESPITHHHRPLPAVRAVGCLRHPAHVRRLHVAAVTMASADSRPGLLLQRCRAAAL